MVTCNCTITFETFTELVYPIKHYRRYVSIIRFLVLMRIERGEKTKNQNVLLSRQLIYSLYFKNQYRCGGERDRSILNILIILLLIFERDRRWDTEIRTYCQQHIILTKRPGSGDVCARAQRGGWCWRQPAAVGK